MSISSISWQKMVFVWLWNRNYQKFSAAYTVLLQPNPSHLTRVPSSLHCNLKRRGVIANTKYAKTSLVFPASPCFLRGCLASSPLFISVFPKYSSLWLGTGRFFFL